MTSLYCVNRIVECAGDKAPERPLSGITRLVVHRISFEGTDEYNPIPLADSLLDAPSVAERDRRIPYVGRMAYHFVVRVDDTIEQAIPLGRRGAHAINANQTGIGVAVVGDFRRHEPTPGQYRKLVALCTRLVMLNGGLLICGHDQVPGGSHDPGKSCPGEKLVIRDLVGAVTDKLPPMWRTFGKAQVDEVLFRAGIVV